MKYYWFDTNCFSDLINGTFSNVEKNNIYEDVKKGEARIIISPFTLYEILKGRNKLNEIKELYDKLINLPPFYIANFLNVFESKAGLFDGKRIINQMKMGEVLGEVPIEYAWFRDGYKEQSGKPYSHYMLQYSKIAAVLYLVCDECDKKGNISLRTETKIQRIEVFDRLGNNRKTIEEMFSEFFINYNCQSIHEDKPNKGLIQEQLLEFVNIMLNVAESRMQLIEEGVAYDKTVFNQRVTENNGKIRVDLKKYHEVLDAISKKTNGKYSPRTIYEKLVKKRIDSLFFKEVCGEFVNKRVLYKGINKTILLMP